MKRYSLWVLLGLVLSLGGVEWGRYAVGDTGSKLAVPARLPLANLSQVPVFGLVDAEFTAALSAGLRLRRHLHQDLRLPTSILPVNYSLDLSVDLAPLFRYSGSVTIDLWCVNTTDVIVIHVKGDSMLVESAVVTGPRIEPPVRIVAARRADEYEQLQFKLSRPMNEGSDYRLRLAFSANLSHSMTGFYRSSYHAPPHNIRHWLATTHFEPTDARAAFPCFDEPSMKANFEISIEHDSNLKALSNMPAVKRDSITKGRTRTRFANSVKMSTYLVAFVISDFECISRVTAKRFLPVRVCTPPHQLKQGKLALNAAADILEYFEDFFGVKFPLPKVDLVAIPDFAAGAMENWGLITYRSTALLVDPNESSTANKQWVVSVVAHELAHQWFGNIVTMQWWNDLWLNEGFASFVQDLGAQHFDKSMQVVQQFATTTLTTALALDGLKSTHPIAATVNDPNEINSIFDAISYSKGAAVIRMLEFFIGSKAFQSGLSKYLKAHSFRNAETHDLWHAWAEAVNRSIDVAEIMDSWTRQEGFPLVTITVNQNRTGYEATQSRFFASPHLAEGQRKRNISLWHIPLAVTTQNARWLEWTGQACASVSVTPPQQKSESKPEPEQPKNRKSNRKRHRGRRKKKSEGLNSGCNSTNGIVWMHKAPVWVQWGKPRGWVKANYGQMGVYRVTYDDETWGLLAQQLRKDHTALSPVDRAGMLDDAFALARASYVGLTLPLNLTRYLTKEQAYLPWSAALRGLGKLGDLLKSREIYGDFCGYLAALVVPSLKRIGWRRSGSHLERYLRTELYHAALECDMDIAREAVLKEFARWSRGGWFNRFGYRVHPDHRYLVYTTGVRYGGPRAWERVRRARDMAVSSGASSEEAKLRIALASSEMPWLLRRLLSMTLDQETIRRQDAISVVCAVANNPVAETLAWEFIQEHWSELRSRYGALSFELGRLLKCVISAHATARFRLAAVKKFFEGRDVGAAAAALEQALEEAEGNVAFLDRHEPELRAWLRAATNKVRRGGK